MAHKGHISMGWRTRAGVLAAVGVALAGASLPASAAVGPSLGAARSFAALAGSTLTNTGSTTIVNGDVGVSPGSEITGFGPGQVTGGTYVGGDTKADQAHSDAYLAYNFLAGMASIPANNLTGTDMGGLTLAPGVWKFNTAAELTGALVLDAGGDSGAVFVFQIGSTLTTAPGSSITVINGGANYDESNVFWQVGSSATLGLGTAFTGSILAYASITLETGSSMTGNALALVGAVTLDSNSVTSPPPAAPPVPVPGAPAAPGNLTAAPIGPAACTGTELSWTDASDNEAEFRVFRRDGAAPGFVLLDSVATTDMAGTGGLVTYQDQVLDASTTYFYRVTAFSPADGESVPSNEVRVESCVGGGGGGLNVMLGRSRSIIRDLSRARKDVLTVKGAYSVIGADTLDPRTVGVTIQVRAPGSLVVVSIPADDAGWKVSKKGVYRWKTPKGDDGIVSSFQIDTAKSEFTLKSKGNDFGSVPVNSITVSLNYQSATGSDTRAWGFPETLPAGTRALFTVPKTK